jgi:hypothetical protein
VDWIIVLMSIMVPIVCVYLIVALLKPEWF